MTKEQVEAKIKEIIAKDPRFKDADITVLFTSKNQHHIRRDAYQDDTITTPHKGKGT